MGQLLASEAKNQNAPTVSPDLIGVRSWVRGLRRLLRLRQLAAPRNDTK